MTVHADDGAWSPKPANTQARSSLAADVETLRTFLSSLFVHADDNSFVALRAFHDNGMRDERAILAHGVRIGTEHLAEEVALRIAEAANYPTPAVFCSPIATFKEAEGAKTTDLDNGLALSTECDGPWLQPARTDKEPPVRRGLKPSVALGRLSAVLGPPTLVVASGGECTDPKTGEVEPKLHLHWRLTEPTRDKADHELLHTARLRATRLVDADATGVPVVHPYRCAGSWHRKTAEPRLVSIVSRSENEVDLADALDRLKAALPSGDAAETAHRARPRGENGSKLAAEHVVDVAAALAVIPNGDLPWPEWNRVGMAAFTATGGCEEGFEAFDAWSRKSAKYDPDVTRARWDHYPASPPDRLGAGTLFYLAKQAQPGWRKPSDVGRNTKDQPSAPEPDQAPQGEGAGEAEEETRTPIAATAFRWIDPATIPPRSFLYGRHLIRKFVSTTVAPGGVGKSSLGIVEALAMASGKPLLGVEPPGRLRVWLWNGEDPLEELQRRIMAAAWHYGLTPGDFEDYLFLDSGRVMPIVIAEQARDGTTIAKPVVREVVQTLLGNRIDVQVVDPFVASHRVTENDNNAIERVAKTWAGIADEASSGIDLVHHVRKTNGAEVTVEDGRGATALLWAARSARVLNGMSADEAAKAGLDVERRRFHFRVDNGKANLAPPEATRWFHLASVDLGNGDNVGVVEPWSWPDAFANVTVADLRRAQMAVAAGGPWRENPQARDWVGRPIAQALGLNPTDKAHIRKIAALLKVWIETGMFARVTGRDPKRRDERTFVEVGQWATD